MQKTAQLLSSRRHTTVFGDSPSLSYRRPPGIALHGDEWELILGIEMPLAQGLSGSSEHMRSMFEMHGLGEEA